MPTLEEVLIDQGLVRPAQVDDARRLDEELRGGLGLNLVRLRYLTEEDLVEACRRAVPGIGVADMAALTDASSFALGLVPLTLIERYRAVPVSLRGSELTVAMANPLDADAASAIERHCHCRVTPVVAAESVVSWALLRYFNVLTPSYAPNGTAARAAATVSLTDAEADAGMAIPLLRRRRAPVGESPEDLSQVPVDLAPQRRKSQPPAAAEMDKLEAALARMERQSKRTLSALPEVTKIAVPPTARPSERRSQPPAAAAAAADTSSVQAAAPAVAAKPGPTAAEEPAARPVLGKLGSTIRTLPPPPAPFPPKVEIDPRAFEPEARREPQPQPPEDEEESAAPVFGEPETTEVEAAPAADASEAEPAKPATAESPATTPQAEAQPAKPATAESPATTPQAEAEPAKPATAESPATTPQAAAEPAKPATTESPATTPEPTPATTKPLLFAPPPIIAPAAPPKPLATVVRAPVAQPRRMPSGRTPAVAKPLTSAKEGEPGSSTTRPMPLMPEARPAPRLAASASAAPKATASQPPPPPKPLRSRVTTPHMGISAPFSPTTPGLPGLVPVSEQAIERLRQRIGNLADRDAVTASALWSVEEVLGPAGFLTRQQETYKVHRAGKHFRAIFGEAPPELRPGQEPRLDRAFAEAPVQVSVAQPFPMLAAGRRTIPPQLVLIPIQILGRTAGVIVAFTEKAVEVIHAEVDRYDVIAAAVADRFLAILKKKKGK